MPNTSKPRPTTRTLLIAAAGAVALMLSACSDNTKNDDPDLKVAQLSDLTPAKD